MEYQVPQFIDVEDKVVGPLTLKQFIYLAGGIGICVSAYLVLSFLPATLIAVPVAALAIALAFYKLNGKNFVQLLEAGISYYTGSKLFLWHHEDQKEPETPSAAAAAAAEREAQASRATPRLTRGKLSELAWSLDIQKKDTQ